MVRGSGKEGDLKLSLGLTAGALLLPTALLIGLFLAFGLDGGKPLYLAVTMGAFIATVGSVMAGRYLQRRLWPSATSSMERIMQRVALVLPLVGGSFLLLVGVVGIEWGYIVSGIGFLCVAALEVKRTRKQPGI